MQSSGSIGRTQGGRAISVSIYQVDAFASRPFAGNPAAVCLLRQPRDAAWMQMVAAEMNLSETAFLLPIENGYSLRWFTPTVEVDLCGHATLACAHILWETSQLPAEHAVVFQTKSGELSARRDGEWIVLEFPAFQAEAISPPADLVKGLGTQPVSVSLSANGSSYVAEMESEESVRQLRPNFASLSRLNTDTIATAPADDPQIDFVSRYFAPSQGIDEDPVTGSAHCVLGPYWQKRLGKSEFVAHQVSRRGGVLRVRVEGDRALIAGQAVTALRGELTEQVTGAAKGD